MGRKSRAGTGASAAAAVLPEEIVTSLPEEVTTSHTLLLLDGKMGEHGTPAALTPPVGNTGEDRIITDFGPGGRVLGRSSGGRNMSGKDDASEYFAFCSESVTAHSSLLSCFDPQFFLDRRVTDEQGLRRRVVYDPTELARVLHLCSKRSRHRDEQSRGIRSPPDKSTGLKRSVAANNVDVLLDRLAGMLETALDPRRPGRESLLICKAVTDAYLVNAQRLARPAAAVIAEGGGTHPIDLEVDFFVDALREAWRHAVEHWNGDADEPHSAADLHVTASWFQAWSAADDMRGGGEPTMDTYNLHRMLPGNWAWVLDHLEIAGAPEGFHLDEELELEKAEERRLKLPPESWGVVDLNRALQDVSDEEWFQEGGAMLDLKVFGPNRPSTFRRVFSNVPGAIYGCLKDQTGVGSTPPAFRMYTTGDLFEALGEDAMMRSRDVTVGESSGGQGEAGAGGCERISQKIRLRQFVSVVELQVTWVGRYTQLLVWLDFMQVKKK